MLEIEYWGKKTHNFKEGKNQRGITPLFFPKMSGNSPMIKNEVRCDDVQREHDIKKITKKNIYIKYDNINK